MPHSPARRSGNRRNPALPQHSHPQSSSRIRSEEPTMHRWSPGSSPTPPELSAQQSLLQALSYQNELLHGMDQQLRLLVQRLSAKE